VSAWSPPSHPPYALRLASAADLDALWEVERSAHAHPWTRELLGAELDTAQSRVWCACDEAGAVCGLLVFWVIGDLVDILDVAVHTRMQRRGVAAHMLRALFELCAASGVTEITLEVREHNAPALALYQRAGFAAVGRRKGYYSDTGEAAVLMSASVAIPATS
jgi:ribosomal-protein-alanine N-acetyltransferase